MLKERETYGWFQRRQLPPAEAGTDQQQGPWRGAEQRWSWSPALYPHSQGRSHSQGRNPGFPAEGVTTQLWRTVANNLL